MYDIDAERLKDSQIILEALNREPEATHSVLLQTMKSAIDSFYGEAQQTDDLTMLSLKYYGTGQPSDEWK